MPRNKLTKEEIKQAKDLGHAIGLYIAANEKRAIAEQFLLHKKTELCAANKFDEAKEYAVVIERIKFPAGSEEVKK